MRRSDGTAFRTGHRGAWGPGVSGRMRSGVSLFGRESIPKGPIAPTFMRRGGPLEPHEPARGLPRAPSVGLPAGDPGPATEAGTESP